MKTIIFSGPMVRAILNTLPGTWPPQPIDPSQPCKGVTRRIMAEALDMSGWAGAVCPARDAGYIAWWPGDDPGLVDFTKQYYATGFLPKYQTGDVLWVREACRLWFPIDDESNPIDDYWHVRYAADNVEALLPVGWDEGPDYASPHDAGVDTEPKQWRPSIHMPKWVCRLWLRVRDVRPERVQEITEEEALLEGIEFRTGPILSPYRNYMIGKKGEMNQHCSSPIRSFQTLWHSIHGPKSWDENPWVWRVEFERVEKPEGW